MNNSVFKDSKPFSGFSVKDLATAKTFYSETLGLDVKEEQGGLQVTIGNDNTIFMYPKVDHKAATYTVLNFPVDNIDSIVDELNSRGVNFEQYDDPLKTDEKGIARARVTNRGPDIAWFKDPSGNIISIIQM